MTNQQTQDIWANIINLGSLVSTPGVDEETQKLANEQIRELLEMLKPALVKLSAISNGIIT